MGGPLSLVLLTRDQREESLVAVDAKTGETKELVHEKDAVFLNAGRPIWLRDGSGFLWASDRSGPLVLELHAPDGALVRTLTPSALGYHAVAGLDLKAKSVFVTAAAEPV